MGSIYDSYKLTNSTVIPMYQGSAAPEAIQVGQHLQQLYDVAKQGSDDVGDAATNNLQYLDQDKANAQAVQSHIKGNIDQMSKAGDWENHVDDVRSLGRYYANRAKELAQPLGQYQKWVEDEVNSKDKNLTPDQKNIAKAMGLARYKGLQDDGTGKLVGAFNGQYLAKNIDRTEWANKQIKDMAAVDGGTETTRDPDGTWRTKHGDTWSIISPTRIKTVLQKAMALDPEYSASKQMDGEQAGFMAAQKIKSIDQIDPTLRPQVMAYMQKGNSLSDAVAALHNTATQGQIDQNILDYAVTKFAKNNHKTIDDQEIGDVAKAAKLKALDDFPIMVGQGPNSAPQWTTDADQVQKEIKTSQDSIDNLTGQLATVQSQINAKPNDPATSSLKLKAYDLKQQIAENKKLLETNQNIWGNSKDAAVQDLKLTDGNGHFVSSFDQFTQSAKPRMVADVKAAIPNGVTVTRTAKDGGKSTRTYTPDQIAEAILQGRMEKSTSIAMGDDSGQSDTKVKLRMPDGTVIEDNSVGSGNFSHIGKISNSASGLLDKIESRAQDLHSQVAKNHSITTNTVGFDEPIKNALQHFPLGNATIYDKVGTNEVSTDKDLYKKKFVPEGFNVETGRIQGYFEDSDGKNRTEEKELRMTSNLAQMLLTNMSKHNNSGMYTQYLKPLADRAYQKSLINIQPDTKFSTVPDSNGNISSTGKPLILNGKKVNMVLDGGTNQWAILDDQGNTVKKSDGSPYATTSISTAQFWIDQMASGKF